MGKGYNKYLGVNKAGGGVGKRTAGAGGKGKGTAGIPLTGKAKSLGVKKATTAGGGNGKRLGAGPRGAKGAGGRGAGGASTLSHADDHRRTAVKVMNEYYHEEENRGSCSFEDERSTFSSTRRTTIKTSVKVTNEYYHEEETFRVSQEDIPDATELLTDGLGGGYGDYYKDAGVGDDDAGFEAVDEFLNGDAYYDDVAAAGFDYLYDDDGADGPDDWW